MLGFDSIVGTPYYLAPEILSGSYGIECDCWSLGVIMYTMLSGYLPFPGENHAEVYDKVREGTFNFDYKEFESVSDAAKDLINKLLTVNKDERFTCLQALSHIWFEQQI